MNQAQPIIVKKKKNVSGDGHHGGAWKVAYADFVTAMMAFFLLMWLLNATSEEQRKGLADYFDPSIPISRTSAGGLGVLGGDTIFVPPEASGSQSEGVRPQKTSTDPGEDLGELAASPDMPPGEQDADGGPPTRAAEIGESGLDPSAASLESLEQNGVRNLAAVQDQLMEEMLATGSDGILEHFSMRMTPEGLVIEIVDVIGEPLFQSGAPTPEPILGALMSILVPVLGKVTNDVAIAGHTDAAPFTGRNNYSNWELSAERANAARRLMVGAGLPEERVVRVSGRAATNPIADDPFAPTNRRIAITLLRN